MVNDNTPDSGAQAAVDPSNNPKQNNCNTITNNNSNNNNHDISYAVPILSPLRSPTSSNEARDSPELDPIPTYSFAEQPIPWSPQVPSQIQPLLLDEHDADNDDIHIEHIKEAPTSSATSKAKVKAKPKPKATSKTKPTATTSQATKAAESQRQTRNTKQRLAHQPIIPKDKQERPRHPLGVAKKVAVIWRVKYLDVIIDEYINTGKPENEAYKKALEEEQKLAQRAANKSIYVNLVAGLKKKIREEAGISTLPQVDNPKYVDGNKIVSHSDMLVGKVRGTFSIEKRRRLNDPE